MSFRVDGATKFLGVLFFGYLWNSLKPKTLMCFGLYCKIFVFSLFYARVRVRGITAIKPWHRQTYWSSSLQTAGGRITSDVAVVELPQWSQSGIVGNVTGRQSHKWHLCFLQLPRILNETNLTLKSPSPWSDFSWYNFFGDTLHFHPQISLIWSLRFHCLQQMRHF